MHTFNRSEIEYMKVNVRQAKKTMTAVLNVSRESNKADGIEEDENSSL